LSPKYPIPQTEDGIPFLRMQELTQETGLPKSTITHYVNQGLIPEPVRTSRNMAWYHPATIDRIKVIRHMLTQHRMSVSEVKALLDNEHPQVDVYTMMEFHEMMFHGADEPLCSLDDLCTKSGLPLRDARKALKLGLLMPKKKGRFNQDDVAVATALVRMMQFGVPLEEADGYPKLAKEIVDFEMEMHARITGELPRPQAMEVTLIMTKMAQAMRKYYLDRTFFHRVSEFHEFPGKDND